MHRTRRRRRRSDRGGWAVRTENKIIVVFFFGRGGEIVVRGGDGDGKFVTWGNDQVKSLKVSVIDHLLNKGTMKLTFENFFST